VLLLDEPTFGQDALTWAALVELLDAERRDGRAVVAVTHDERFLGALGARRFGLTAPAVAADGAA
jgi:energy-coupling factor transport system ATP-binding protein